MVFEGKWNGNFEKDRESNGESNVWCKTDGEKEDWGPNGNVRIEGNSGSDGKGDGTGMCWGGMMGMFWEKRWSFNWRAREARTTKKDVEDASGGEQECWFGEKGCHESSETESGSWTDCCQSGINPASPIYEDKPGSKLEWWWWWWTLF